MKKLFFLFFTILIINSINVNAETAIITSTDTLDDSYLQEENMQVIESNVNWSQPGKYQVKYLDLITKEFINKDVIVHSDEELANGVDYFTKQQIFYTNEIHIYDMIFINENEFYAFGSKNVPYYPSQDGFISVAYISYFKNGTLLWEKVINDSNYGAFINGCKTETGIALIGSLSVNGQETNIGIYEFTNTGQITYNLELQGSLDDYGYNIFYNYGYLYFVGSTYSNDGDFNHFTNSDKNIIIGSVNLKEPNNYMLTAIGNSNDDIYYDSVFYNDKIYIYMKFVGDGYFTSGMYSTFTSIISINDRLDLGEWISLNDYNIKEESSLEVINDKISLVTRDSLSNRITFFLFDYFLYYLSNKSIVINQNYYILDYDLIINGSRNFLLCEVRDVDGNKYNTLTIFDENYQVSQSNEIPIINYNYKSFGLYQQNDGKIIFINWNNLNYYFEIVKFVNYYLKDNIKEYSTYTFYEKNLYLNGQKLNYQIFKNNVNSNPFGLYTNLYQVKLNDSKFIIPMNFDYKAVINVKSREIYDLNLKLSFNGNGFLNDELITTGYMINEVGKYVLEIFGNNGETETVSFSVNKLSENVSPTVDFNNHLDIGMNKVIYEDIEEENKPYLNLMNYNKTESGNYDIFIIIGFIFIGSCIGIFLPKNLFKVHKK